MLDDMKRQKNSQKILEKGTENNPKIQYVLFPNIDRYVYVCKDLIWRESFKNINILKIEVHLMVNYFSKR